MRRTLDPVVSASARVAALAALALVACAPPAAYSVELRFASPAVRAPAASVDLYVVHACGALGTSGDDPLSTPLFARTIALGTGSASMSLDGAVAPGAVGLYARARAADCTVIAAGCTPVTLVAGGHAALVVALDAVAGPGAACPDGTTCVRGACSTAPLDGGVDAGDAGSDVGADMPVASNDVCGADSTVCAGSCTDTQSDVHNCGACGRDCTVGAHVASARCMAGACVPECATSYDSCAGDACETYLGDVANCGACGRACASGQSCMMAGGIGVSYRCTAGCAFSTCGTACVNEMGDATNCGACGHVCPVPTAHGDGTCSGGVCGVACFAGYSVCAGQCVQFATDAANCGACGRACVAPANGTATCAASACGVACNPGYALMSGACVVHPCGDHVLAPSEECDDGNNANGDGCSATCALESSGAFICMSTGAPLIVAPGGPQGYRVDTSSTFASMTICSLRAYTLYFPLQFTAAGTLTITLTPAPDVDAAIGLRPTCATGASVCTNAGSVGGAETTTLDVPSASYTTVLEVMGVTPDDGPMVVTLTLR